MFFIIRHGETEWNKKHIVQGRSDIPLNKKGREQARKRAQAFKGADIEAIYTSPLKRASETASIIADCVGCKNLYKDERLRERYFGSLDGKRTLNKPFKFYYSDLPDGEHQDEVYSRLMSVLEEISKKHTGNVLIITHGAISGTFVSHNTDEDFRLVNTACIAVEPHSLKMIDFNLSEEEIRSML